MTEESLTTANYLIGEIKKVDETIRKIRPYMDEVVKLKIIVQKTLQGYSFGDKEETFLLNSTDPLLLSICSALEDMKSELKNRFDKLDSNSEEKVIEPIKKTSFWKKVWN